ncbi:MAG TPA: FtsX-like permease family protein [Candidatus Angelobacter sp.]|nr:FtsX-like permease family protein [Candidatus Angelobacter sp.]
MRAYDLIELAGRNLREAGLRNSLTTLGIGVGVASLVAMLSLGIGLQKLATRQLGRSGLFDTVVVTSRQDGRGPRFTQAAPVTGQAKPLDDAARHSFEQMANVAEVYPNFSAVGDIRLETNKTGNHFTVVGTLPQSARNSESFDDVQGNFFSSYNAQEAIILSDFGRELLDVPREPRGVDVKLTQDQANQLLGKYIVLRYHKREAGESAPLSGKPIRKKGEPDPDDVDSADDPQGQDQQSFNLVPQQLRLKIVGIVSSEPNRGLRQGRTPVFLPLALAETLDMVQAGELWSTLRPSDTKTYIALIVRVAKSKAVAQVEEDIKKQGFSTFSILDASKGITRFFTFLDLFLGIFGSLALAVASLGIVNTLVMAILERRREIGIMKALGASDGDVKRIFFFEAGSMGLLGGALGTGLGWTIGRVINFATNVYLQRQDIRPENFWVIPPWLVGAALGFSIFVSLFAGLYPASRAARLNPVEALRHD